MPAPTLLLNDGHAMPQIGLGTSPLNDAEVAPAVVSAIVAGYRHLDTAMKYRNQRGVAAIPRSGNPARIAQNIDIFDFALTSAEVAAISALDTGAEKGVDSDTDGH